LRKEEVLQQVKYFKIRQSRFGYNIHNIRTSPAQSLVHVGWRDSSKDTVLRLEFDTARQVQFQLQQRKKCGHYKQ
jgi:hypothetical protein